MCVCARAMANRTYIDTSRSQRERERDQAKAAGSRVDFTQSRASERELIARHSMKRETSRSRPSGKRSYRPILETERELPLGKRKEALTRAIDRERAQRLLRSTHPSCRRSDEERVKERGREQEGRKRRYRRRSSRKHAPGRARTPLPARLPPRELSEKSIEYKKSPRCARRVEPSLPRSSFSLQLPSILFLPSFLPSFLPFVPPFFLLACLPSFRASFLPSVSLLPFASAVLCLYSLTTRRSRPPRKHETLGDALRPTQQPR